MNYDLEAIDGLCAKIIEQRARIEALEAALREIVAVHEANIGRDAELSLHSWEVARAALAPEPDK